MPMSVAVVMPPSITTLAFEFGGHVGQAEVREMADAVLAAFDEHRQIDLLILLPSFTGITPAGALDLKGMKASVLALGKVRRYAVVAPPRWAGAMIELSDALIPVEARIFALRDLEAARAWVNAPSAAEAASAPA